MTADMAFECLLVSRDPSVVCVVNKFLESLSISTHVCFTSSRAADRLAEGSTDLIILDWEDSSTDLLRRIQSSNGRQKPTVVAVSDSHTLLPGAHVVLSKPVTSESCAQPLRFAYNRMLRDHRRHARYSLMTTVTAVDQNQRSIPLTVMDIGDGGVGLISKEQLAVGDTLSFRLLPAGTDRSIFIEARVQWTRRYGAAGCEFIRIPPLDLSVLHDWLKSRCKIKKPLVAL